MIKINVYFESGFDNTLVRLAGLSKRLSLLGFQPVHGDNFNFSDLSYEDKRHIECAVKEPKCLTVASRNFKFEVSYTLLEVYVTAN